MIRKQIFAALVILAATAGARAEDVRLSLTVAPDYQAKGIRILWEGKPVAGAEDEGFAMGRPLVGPLQNTLSAGAWDVVGYSEQATFMGRIEVKPGVESFEIPFDHAPRDCEKLSNRETAFTFSGLDAAGQEIPMPCAAVSSKDPGFAAAAAEVVPTYGLIPSIVDGGGIACERPHECNVVETDPAIGFDLPPMWMSEKAQAVEVDGKPAALVFFWVSFGNYGADPAYAAVLNPVDEEIDPANCVAVAAGLLCKGDDFTPDLQAGFDSLAQSFVLN